MKTAEKDISRQLIDFEGRAITYLRVSLTQQCNLRCSYCFGSTNSDTAGGLALGNREILRLIEAFALLGINKIRFTGGEPLLRRGIVDLVKHTSGIDGISILGLTTNGLLLERLLPRLIDGGLNRINISLDTLRREKFKALAGVDGIDKVMAGIGAAVESQAFPWVKINTVVMRNTNDDELQALAKWALERKIDIRFIEFMPTEKSGWSRDLLVGEKEMREKIGLELEEIDERSKSPGPAVSFRYKNYPGRVSFISAVSRSFCGQCNRLRLTSNGEIYGCLFRSDKIGLATLLKSSASASEISEHILSVISRPGFRRATDDVSITSYRPFMKAVGG